jgi:hypothetical protein
MLLMRTPPPPAWPRLWVTAWLAQAAGAAELPEPPASSVEPPAARPDKSRFTLWDPTPPPLMRELSPDLQLDVGVNLGVTEAADDVNPFIGLT